MRAAKIARAEKPAKKAARWPDCKSFTTASSCYLSLNWWKRKGSAFFRCSLKNGYRSISKRKWYLIYNTCTKYEIYTDIDTNTTTTFKHTKYFIWELLAHLTWLALLDLSTFAENFREIPTLPALQAFLPQRQGCIGNSCEEKTCNSQKKKLFLATSKATIAKQSTIPHSLKINSAKRSANYSVACISSCRIALQSISVESNIIKSVQNLEYLHEIYQHFASPWLTSLKILLVTLNFGILMVWVC